MAITSLSPTPIPICEIDEAGAPWPLAADDPRRRAYDEAHNDWARVRAWIFEEAPHDA
ncbi:hypothetical protein KKF91_19270 [Myxococcota bacterium]|nr:hypothetical protein [Myxococcota bacterium]MBU1432687.1 hypothetical protein [Myxococcota bacterium]MBU1898012.1 hypothetical protein [Myxococcota bacterium]